VAKRDVQADSGEIRRKCRRDVRKVGSFLCKMMILIYNILFFRMFKKAADELTRPFQTYDTAHSTTKEP
jgi:hypothetical protein